MKLLSLLTLFMSFSNYSSAQRGCLEIVGPAYLMADSLTTLTIDHSCCKCKGGQLSYTINDSTMGDMINLESGKKTTEYVLKAPKFPGMHGVYFRYLCEKKMCYGKHLFSVGVPYVEPVTIFEMPDQVVIGKKFKVKLINLEKGEYRLMCDGCDSNNHIQGLEYELLISKSGHHMIWIEEKQGMEWKETWSKDIILD